MEIDRGWNTKHRTGKWEFIATSRQWKLIMQIMKRTDTWAYFLAMWLNSPACLTELVSEPNMWNVSISAIVISFYCKSRLLLVKLPVAFLVAGRKKEIDQKAKKHNPLVFFIQSWQQLQTQVWRIFWHLRIYFSWRFIKAQASFYDAMSKCCEVLGMTDAITQLFASICTVLVLTNFWSWALM